MIRRLLLLAGAAAWVACPALRAQPATRIVSFIDRILRGARPAELSIEQPSRFELMVNQRSARALGLTLPACLLLRATRVIE